MLVDPHMQQRLDDRMRHHRMSGHLQKQPVPVLGRRAVERGSANAVVYKGISAVSDGGNPAVRRPSSSVRASIAGLWNATSVLTRRTITPWSVQPWQTSSTAPMSPEITVDSGDALIAATTSP